MLLLELHKDFDYTIDLIELKKQFPIINISDQTNFYYYIARYSDLNDFINSVLIYHTNKGTKSITFFSISNKIQIINTEYSIRFSVE